MSDADPVCITCNGLGRLSRDWANQCPTCKGTGRMFAERERAKWGYAIERDEHGAPKRLLYGRLGTA